MSADPRIRLEQLESKLQQVGLTIADWFERAALLRLLGDDAGAAAAEAQAQQVMSTQLQTIAVLQDQGSGLDAVAVPQRRRRWHVPGYKAMVLVAMVAWLAYWLYRPSPGQLEALRAVEEIPPAFHAGADAAQLLQEVVRARQALERGKRDWQNTVHRFWAPTSKADFWVHLDKALVWYSFAARETDINAKLAAYTTIIGPSRATGPGASDPMVAVDLNYAADYLAKARAAIGLPRVDGATRSPTSAGP